MSTHPRNIMIVAILTETTLSALSHDVDIIELRLDCLETLDLAEIEQVIKKSSKPVILTLRSTSNGGHFKGTEAERLNYLVQFAALNPAYIDLESSIDDAWITAFHHAHPTIQIIRSYHNFDKTPASLDNLLDAMRHPAVAIYKLITYANTSLDNLRVLNFLKTHIQDTQLVTHCMGPLGLPSRIIGHILGNTLTYAATEDIPAPGCPTLDTLLQLYRLKYLNKATEVFALLGDPVEHSIGHVFHNQAFSERDINAVYLKIELKLHELTEFFELIKNLPFKGFSITTPLKAHVMPYVDLPDKRVLAMGATNTLRIENNKIAATNTDGEGAVAALEQKRLISQSHVLIIGAGGAAKAIAHACAARAPLSLYIANRTQEKALSLAEKVHAKVYENEVSSIDMIINTVPHSETNDAFVMDLIKPYLTAHTIVMQVDYANASALPATILPTEMFEGQAIRQLAYWTHQ